ncbi:SPW repeat domain-containing protein [Roseimaritima ulvae]|uniref:SPW repeat protein n=1 Tax=Roseimaritima ulvae TaxID=980254 RepID=A0A5B9QHX2_9BACT|nr:SPW repeat protein [Roseimaritima ulvae]QEG38454.1 SPW repeat protein [Roseimaritima ulvae]
MWGRVVEIMTAVWLAASPWIFRTAADTSLVWADLSIALAIATLAGLSYWKPTRHAHLLTLLVATGLIVWGRLAGTPPPYEHQNHIVVGLFLLLIALIPNDASNPPRAWRDEASVKGAA